MAQLLPWICWHPQKLAHFGEQSDATFSKEPTCSVWQGQLRGPGKGEGSEEKDSGAVEARGEVSKGVASDPRVEQPDMGKMLSGPGYSELKK